MQQQREQARQNARAGADLEDAVRLAIGALPGVIVHRNPQMLATSRTGTPVRTGIGGVGAPDLVCEVRGADGRYRVLWLECKSGGGVLSKDQRRWHEAAAREGRHVVIVRSAQDAVDAVRRVAA